MDNLPKLCKSCKELLIRHFEKRFPTAYPQVLSGVFNSTSFRLRKTRIGGAAAILNALGATTPGAELTYTIPDGSNYEKLRNGLYILAKRRGMKIHLHRLDARIMIWREDHK